MAETLKVEPRSETGSRAMRRMRSSGRIPAVLYGHGEPNESLSIAADDLLAAFRHHAHVFELSGAAKGSAFLREVQYDPMGIRVLHVDLTRVSADELVDVTLSVHLRGDAVGIRQGGIIEHQLHEVEIQCPVAAIPEAVTLNIAALELGKSIMASDLPLPPGAKLITPAETLVVSCHLPLQAPDAAAAGTTAEPEIIGRPDKKDEAAD